jgi:hypothetical protein
MFGFVVSHRCKLQAFYCYVSFACKNSDKELTFFGVRDLGADHPIFTSELCSVLTDRHTEFMQ